MPGEMRLAGKALWPTKGLDLTVNTCERATPGWSSRLEERVYEAAVA